MNADKRDIDNSLKIQELLLELKSRDETCAKLKEKLQDFEKRYRIMANKAFAGIITERDQAEKVLYKSRERYRIVTNVAQVGIIIVDTLGKLSFVNPAFSKMVGYLEDELLAMSLDHFISTSEFESLRDETVTKKINIKGTFESQLRGNNEKKVDVLVSASLLKDDAGSYIGTVAVFTDICARKKFEKELKKAHNELEETVKKRTIWLSTTNRLLKDEITKRKEVEEDLKDSFVRLKKTLNGTVQVVANVVEAKDPYTSGHQQRVSELACTISKAMNFPTHRIEGMRIAALLHDIGKISIPVEILSKPGKLGRFEFELIQNHPRIGYEILQGIDFPWKISEVVLQHHERLNGSGYPSGLKSDEISLEAKILGVADVVEAMSSNRPYRPALGVDKALSEILMNKAVLYEPDVVDICVKLFTEAKFKFS